MSTYIVGKDNFIYELKKQIWGGIDKFTTNQFEIKQAISSHYQKNNDCKNCKKK